MLPKYKRLKTEEFDVVFKTGHVFHGKQITLRLLKDLSVKDSKFSFVVSKKVASRAVDRNKTKRRGYSILRQSPIKPGYEGIFFLKKRHLLFKDFKDDIVDVLNKAKLLLP